MIDPLRPMSTGQLLDRTVELYREHFLLFITIAAAAPVASVLFRLLTLSAPITRGTHAAASLSRFWLHLLLGWLIILAGGVISHAATVRAVAAVHLGQPISAVGVFRSVMARLARILGVFSLVMLISCGFVLVVIFVWVIFLGIMQLGASSLKPRYNLVLGFVTISIILSAFVMVYVRYALAIQACIIEDLGVRASLKRSVFLSEGSRWRVAAIYSIFLILSLIAGYGFGQLGFRAGMIFHNRIATNTLIYVTTFIASAITAPLGTIGISLLYYDERVRKEAFDLHWMMATIEPAAPAMATTELSP